MISFPNLQNGEHVRPDTARTVRRRLGLLALLVFLFAVLRLQLKVCVRLDLPLDDFLLDIRSMMRVGKKRKQTYRSMQSRVLQRLNLLECERLHELASVDDSLIGRVRLL